MSRRLKPNAAAWLNLLFLAVLNGASWGGFRALREEGVSWERR